MYRGNHIGRVGFLSTPADGFYYAGFHQVQAVEEASDRLRAAEVVRDGATLIVPSMSFDLILTRGSTMAKHQIAAGCQAIHQPLHDRPRLIVVGDVTHDSQQ